MATRILDVVIQQNRALGLTIRQPHGEGLLKLAPVLVPPVLAEALSNGRGPLRVGNGSFAVLGEGHIGLEADEGRRSLTQQTRYDSADILMAADPNVFSRFMLSPTRGDITGEEAIASGGVPTTER